jgi:hypothetical protein
MGGLGQSCEIFAYAGEIGIGGGETGKTACHAEHVKRAGKYGEADGRIAGFQALEGLNRNQHAFRHEPLGQLAPPPRQRNIPPQLRDGALALGR